MWSIGVLADILSAGHSGAALIGGGGSIDHSESSSALPLSMGFTAYESSPLDIAFSAGSLATLTIQESLDLLAKFPPVLPDKTLRVVGWSKAVPEADNFFLVNHSIPSLKDIRQFLGDGPETFAQGYHGVVVEVQGSLTS